MKPNGFTLIEVLVAIGALGVLTTIGLVGYQYQIP